MKKKHCLPLMLPLVAALAACQSPPLSQPSAPEAALVPQRLALDEVENLQLLAAPHAGGDRLLVDGDGLHLLDASGRFLTTLPGKYEGLDHRRTDGRLLVTTLDRASQRALVMVLDEQGDWQSPVAVPRTGYAIDATCLHRDEAGNGFLFLVGEEGIGEQWLVAQSHRLLDTPLRVRGLSLPPDSNACQVDDDAAGLYVNEEAVGWWRYDAGAEAPLQRQPVDLVRPFGQVQEAAAGLARVPGGLLALDPEAARLHRYQDREEGWQALPAWDLAGVDEPEQISARLTADGVELVLVDDQGAWQLTLDWQPRVRERARTLPVIPARLQTEAVLSLGDAADDPAIWVHPRQPERSLILGTDKKGGLLVHDLSGRTVQDLRVGRLNNVDVRHGFRLGDRTVDLAVASNRDHNSLHLFALEPTTGWVTELGQVPTPLDEIYGLCMFRDRQARLYAIVNDKDGRFLQYRLEGASGTAGAALVRSFATASQPEGCVADDRRERLFVGEEDVAVWALAAGEEAPTDMTSVIRVGDWVADDIEGLALYQGGDQDYLVISSQGNDSYVVVEATPPYRLRGAFRIGLNAEAGIDGASETDGLEVTAANLGGPWQQGMLVVQDGRKRMPEGNQNYKAVSWQAVAEVLGLE